MNQARKFYVTMSGLLVLTGLALIGLEIWGILVLTDTRTAAAEENYRASKLSEKIAALNTLAASYEKVKESEDIIESTLPDSKDSSQLLTDLDSLARASGLKITLIQSVTAGKKVTSSGDPSLLQTVKGKYSQELPLNLEVEGNFENLLKFVDKIEKYQRLTNITAVDITKTEDGSSNILAKLKITTYLMK